jgi:hypothetical protein
MARMQPICYKLPQETGAPGQTICQVGEVSTTSCSLIGYDITRRKVPFQDPLIVQILSTACIEMKGPVCKDGPWEHMKGNT